jgi:hypothetical protein
MLHGRHTKISHQFTRQVTASRAGRQHLDHYEWPRYGDRIGMQFLSAMQYHVRLKIILVYFNRHSVTVNVAGQSGGRDRLTEREPHLHLQVIVGRPAREP